MSAVAAKVNRWLLVLTAGALPLGGIARAAGHPRAAARLWAVLTALVLVDRVVAAARALRRRAFGVDLIALLAICGALLLHEFLAGAVIALMLLGGHALEDYAQLRAQRELTSLLQRAPRLAHRCDGETLTEIQVSAVRRGDLLLVKPGEVVPVDGVVEDDRAVLDEAALTGEAAPVERMRWQSVPSGAVNASRAPFQLRATAPAEQSTYAGILRLVRQAQASKAPLVRLADRYAVFFLPLTLAVAGAAWFLAGDPVRALAVLVVATPCPLILATPVAMVAGISRAARRGIIVKGGGALEALARGQTLVLDKTGTVTTGAPTLTRIESFGAHGPDDLLRLAASLSQASPHVLSGPIVRAARARQLSLSFPSGVEEEFGSGIRGRVADTAVAIGTSSWILHGEPAPPGLRRLQRQMALEGAAGVFIAVDGALAGGLMMEDPIRRDAPLTLRSLRRVGFRRIVLLSGDSVEVSSAVGAMLGADQVFAERSPAEKVEVVQLEHAAGVTVMVGDGINDSPALAAADVGVAMGARGASASSEAADIVLVVDRLDRLIDAVRIARRSRAIALQSIGAGMGLSLVAMGFASAGLLSPIAGALLQEVIDVVVILNALRVLAGGHANAPPRASSVLQGQLQAEHQRLWPALERIRHLADRLDQLPPRDARTELATLHEFLRTEVLPHEAAEEAAVYPTVATLIGGEDPTAPMVRAHLEISHMVRLLGRYLDEVPPEGPAGEDIRDLRRLLYGLHAILRLHFVQEDEAYLALMDAHAAS